MERKLYLLSPLQAEFYENESDRMYPDDVMDGRALAVYGADILQKMQERADHVGEDLMEYYDEKDSATRRRLCNHYCGSNRVRAWRDVDHQ